MTFEQALREWGARKLDQDVDRTTVTVEWSAESTSDCDTCGPSSEMVIEISGRVPNDGVRWATVRDYGMATFVRELDAIASEQSPPVMDVYGVAPGGWGKPSTASSIW